MGARTLVRVTGMEGKKVHAMSMRVPTLHTVACHANVRASQSGPAPQATRVLRVTHVHVERRRERERRVAVVLTMCSCAGVVLSLGSNRDTYSERVQSGFRYMFYN